MKILFLATHLNPGGITTYVFLLARGLISQGHQVYVATSGGSMVSILENLGCKHITVDIKTRSELNPKLYFSLFKLAGIIKREKIDVVHTQMRTTHVMGYFLKKITRRPHVTTCHGFYKLRLGRRLFPCWGDRVIAISSTVKEQLIESFRVDEKDIRLIPHGLKAEKYPYFTEEEKKEKKEAFHFGNQRIIGMIARLADVKGQDVLINAMPLILKKCPDVKLVLVGEGKMEQRLKQLAVELNLKDQVLFYPVISKATEMLALFDVFILPSIEEGLGLSIMEAQACGLPVVASSVGGLVSLVEHEKTGLLVPPKDAPALASAVIRLLQDKVFAQRLGEKAREFINREFSLEKMIQQTINMYEEFAPST